MAKRLLNDVQDSYLRKIALGRSNQECADMLNKKFNTSFSKLQIQNYKSHFGITSGKKPWEFAHSPKKLLTPEQDKFLRDNVHMKSSRELAEMINKKFGTSFTDKQIKGYKSRYKIVSGFDGKFRKGMTPANKGKKLSKELYEKAKPTMFKAGDKPANTQPVGTVIKRDDGYWWKKYYDDKVPARRNWVQIHRYMWEEAYGPIPDDCVIVFKDGNRDHIELDNLMIVTKHERVLMAKNHYFSEVPEITESGAMVAKVLAKISDKKSLKRVNKKEGEQK